MTAAIDAGLKGPKGFTTPSAAVKTLRLTLPTILVANDVAQKPWQVAATPTAFILSSYGVVEQVLEPGKTVDLAGAIEDALAGTK
jgi:hypothetical protein